jgi:hypothetical protein
MQLPIRQQSIRVQDITPPKMMNESACLKKLTTYGATTIRKCPPSDPKKEPRGTWARAEIIEERWAQEDILKQIKKLSDRGRSVADKKKALAHNMQGQITALLDDLASKEVDRAFEWSLVQLDTVQKPLSSRAGKRGSQYETVTMTVYVKRAPLKDLNPVILLQNIEKMKADKMRPPPPPQGGQQGGLPNGVQLITPIERRGSKDREQRRSKSREKKYHDQGDSSSGDSFDSDTASHSSYSDSDSLDTSISSKSRGHGRRGHGRAVRSHSRHRPRKPYYIDHHPRAHSPERLYDHYRQQPYVPDVPRALPAVAALPTYDPVTAAYNAGKADAEAERYGTADRVLARPVSISYGPPLLPEHRRSEPLYMETRYADEFRRDEGYPLRRREREAEEYIEGRLDGRLDGRRPHIERRHTDLYNRRPSPVIWATQQPFSPIRHQYSPSSSDSAGW